MAPMNKLKTKLKVASTGSLLLFLVGCGCFPKPPVIKPKQIIQRLNVCKVYNATFGSTLTFKYEKDIPLDECLVDGHFVLTDTELVDIRRTYNEAYKCHNEQRNCKPKKGKK